MKDKPSNFSMKALFALALCFIFISVSSEVKAQVPGVLTLISPANNANVLPGKTIHFTWNAPPSGATPFTYTFYFYNGSSWANFSAGSNLYYDMLLKETGGSSLCGVGAQWYVKATNSYGSTNSATWNFVPYPKYSGSSADYSITPSTSCQSSGADTIVTQGANYYSFTATAGYSYYFSTCSSDLRCGSNTTWDTYLKIYGTNNSCTMSAYNDNSGGCGNGTSFINGWTCSTTGTYILQITGYNKFAYGTYYLQYSYTCPTLTAGSVGSNQSICYNTSPAAFTQTGAPTGGTGSYTYQWQNTTVAGCGSGWSDIGGATASTYDVTGNITQTTCYRRVVTSSPCGSANSSAITVTVYANLTAGSVGSNQSICYNSSPAAFTQTGAPSGGTGSYSYQWQNTTVAGCGSGWGNISGATASTYQAPALTTTTCYRRNVTSGSCGTVSSSAITANVYANLTSGSVGSSQTICYNTSPVAFTQTGAPSGGTGSYTYQWQNTTVSGCGSGWGNISSATASTYQAPALTATTCYRRNVTSGSCGTVSSSAITATVYANLTAGSVGSNQSICYNTSPAAFTQTGAPSGGTGSYTYQWQNTTVSGCASGWADIGGATATTYQAPALTATTCYRRNVTSGSCGTVNSSAITITVNPLPLADAGNNDTINAGDSTQIGSSPVGGYTYAWSPATGLSSTTIANPWASPTETKIYFLTVTDDNMCVNYDTVVIEIKDTFSLFQSFISKNGFIENKGQIYNEEDLPNNDIKYLLALDGLNIHLKENSFSYDSYFFTVDSLQDTILKFHRVDIELLNSNLHPNIIAYEPSDDYFNYYNYVTPDTGANYVKYYKRVLYENIYNNIDLEFIVQPDSTKPIKYNFIIYPGANPSQIKLIYKGAYSTDIINGEIVISVNQKYLKESIPSSYLQTSLQTVNVEYLQLGTDTFSFEIPSYDTSQTLVIDPIIQWGTYYGGLQTDRAMHTTVDASGNVYIAGYTSSTYNIATTNTIGGSLPYQTTLVGSVDAFLVKFNTNGTREWGTYYGGQLNNKFVWGQSCAVDALGHIYLAGSTNASNLSTTGSHQAQYRGWTSAFLAQMNCLNGTRNWATYYGGWGTSGSAMTYGWSCSVDNSDNNNYIYLAGNTTSPNSYTYNNTQFINSIATSNFNEHQVMLKGGSDAFLVKFTNNGTRLWGTYFGGSYNEYGRSCATDNDGNVYLTGSTGSSDFISYFTPGTISHQSNFYGGATPFDAFLTKFDGTSGQGIWGTYFGGHGDEEANSVTVDSDDDVYIAGSTLSNDFISYTNTYQVNYDNNQDAFVAKFDGIGTRLWGTYYGGSSVEHGLSCATDECGNLFLTGLTSSSNNIAYNNSQSVLSGSDAFIMIFDKTNGQGIWGSYFGGGNSDCANSCITDNNANIYIAGETLSANGISYYIPGTTISHQQTYGGQPYYDAFLAKFYYGNTASTPSYEPTLCINTALNPAITISTTVATGIENDGISGANGLPMGVSATWNNNLITISGTPTVSGTFNYSILLTGGCSLVYATGVITVNPISTITLISDIAACPGDQINVGNFVGVPAGSSFTWTNSNTAIGLSANGTGNITSWTAPANATGANIVGTISVTSTLNGCSGIPMTFTISIYPTLTQGVIGTAQTICYNTAPTQFNFSTVPTGGNNSYTYQWQSSAAGCGSFSDISGATSSTYSPGVLTATTCYLCNVTSCGETKATTSITITVNPILIQGVIGTDQTICYNTAPNNFTQVTSPNGGTGTYTYQWQSTTVSGCGSGWADILGATATTYQAGSLTTTTCFRRNETSGSCGTVSSNTITVTVYANLVAGTVAANQTICYNTSPGSFTQTGSPTGGTGSYTYQWQSQPGCSGGWSNISGATATTYQAPALTSTTCYRRNETSGSCGTVSSNTITVTVTPIYTVNQITSISVCPGAAINIGNFVSNPTGATFTWTNDNTAIGIAASGNGDISSWTAPATGANIVGTISVTPAFNGCIGTPMTFTVTIHPTPLADAGSPVTICAGSNTTLGTTASSGTTYTWSPTGSLSNPYIATPIATPTATTTYTVIATNTYGCSATDDVVVSLITDLCLCDAIPMPTTWDAGYVSTLNPSTLYELSQNASISGNVVLTGISIRIDDFIPNSSSFSITIQTGSKLTLDNCHLFACEKLWEGIIVNGSGELEIINGTLIEDAKIAVNVNSISSPSVNTLNIDGSVFNKNSIGVSIAGYQANSAPYPFTITNSIFTSRVLTPVSLATWPTPATLGVLEQGGNIDEHYSIGDETTSLLLNGNPAQTGIALNNVGTFSTPNYFEMLINGDNSNETINIFDNLYFGISAINSNFTCQNNAFQYIIGTPNVLTDGFGVLSQNTSAQLPLSPSNRLQVDGGNNFFYDCKTAVNAVNYDVVIINNVNIRSTGNTGISKGFLGIGINTPQSSDIEVNSNTITNVNFGVLFTGSHATFGSNTTAQYIHGIFQINNNIIQADLGGNVPYTTGKVSIGIVASSDPVSSTINFDDCNELEVKDNHLYNVRNGIKMEQWQYAYFETGQNQFVCAGNRPYISDNFIQLVDPLFTSQYGIYTSSNWNEIIMDNNVQGFSFANTGYYGIVCAFNTVWGIHKQIVNCNKMEYTGTGIQFDGDQTQTSFFRNEMNGNQWGFVLSANTAIGTQGINDPNGINSIASDNIWLESTYVGTGHYKTYTSNSPDPMLSELIVVPYATDPDRNPKDITGNTYNSGLPNTNVYFPGNGLTDLIGSNNNPVVCSIPSSKSVNSNGAQSNFQGNGSNKHIKWLERLVKDSVNFAVFPVEQHINDLFRIYRIIEMQPDLKDSSAILKHFHHIAKNGHIGALVNIETALAGGQLSQSALSLASVTPQNDIESNYIDFYNVYIHYKDSTYSVADSIKLKTLVDGCVVRDGMAVAKARTLYSMIYRDYNLYPDNCIDNNADKMLSNTIKEKINPADLFLEVYPNPNNGTFTISLNGDNSKSETAEVTIYNLIGNKMSVFNLELRNNSAIFDTKLSNGIYFLFVKDDVGNVYKSEKIIIIK